MKEILEKLRAYFFVILTVAAACLGSYRLMKIQIVDGDSYLQRSKTASVSNQIIDAPRGEIVDADNEPLVSNKSCFNVIVNKAFFPASDTEKNRIILDTALLLENEGCTWHDILPVSAELPFQTDPTREDKVLELRKHIGVQIYATAEQCIYAMCDNYNISDEYSDREKRIIAGVRYTMDMRNFSVSNTYIFAEDISMETVIRLKERSFELDGIDVVEDAVRVYGAGDVVPHLIGTVGAIDADEYAELSSKGYALDDTVGKSGIELAMESVLRGHKGTRTIEMLDGEVAADTITDEAVPGNTVKLTIDSDYQRNVQTILENHITWLRNQTLPDAAGTDANAGAIVVLNAKTGALLAAATAPTYNLNDYIADYASVAGGENSPLNNRATNARYRPGSTFKTVTATAALNEGIISPYTEINCNKVYTYWEDYRPECTGWHGRFNVVSALRESCNIFFYETGRLTGIDTIKYYAGLYGLGGEAGLETGRGINRGYIASPEVFDELELDWQAGNIVQAAIGQSETAVTPLQMAAQAMTIANNGLRFETYMVDSVYTYNMEELVSKTLPSQAEFIKDKTGYTFSTIKEGMKQAAAFSEYAYPKPGEKDYYLGEYLLTALPREAAIKTGTPQMTTADDTGSAFIGFYPADDPQIAFAGFVEHGEYSKFMVRQIIEAYYEEDYSIEKLEGASYPEYKEEETEEETAEEQVYEEQEEESWEETDYSYSEPSDESHEETAYETEAYSEEYSETEETEPITEEETEISAEEITVKETEASAETVTEVLTETEQTETEVITDETEFSAEISEETEIVTIISEETESSDIIVTEDTEEIIADSDIQ